MHRPPELEIRLAHVVPRREMLQRLYNRHCICSHQKATRSTCNDFVVEWGPMKVIGPYSIPGAPLSRNISPEGTWAWKRPSKLIPVDTDYRQELIHCQTLIISGPCICSSSCIPASLSFSSSREMPRCSLSMRYRKDLHPRLWFLNKMGEKKNIQSLDDHDSILQVSRLLEFELI